MVNSELLFSVQYSDFSGLFRLFEKNLFWFHYPKRIHTWFSNQACWAARKHLQILSVYISLEIWPYIFFKLASWKVLKRGGRFSMGFGGFRYKERSYIKTGFTIIGQFSLFVFTLSYSRFLLILATLPHLGYWSSFEKSFSSFCGIFRCNLTWVNKKIYLQLLLRYNSNLHFLKYNLYNIFTEIDGSFSSDSRNI